MSTVNNSNVQNLTQSIKQNVAVLKTSVGQLTLTSKDLTSSLMFRVPLPRPSFISIFVSTPSKMPYAEYARRLKAIAHDIQVIQVEVKYGDKKSYEALVQLKGRAVSAFSSLKAQFGMLVKRIENDLTNNMQDTQTTVTHMHTPTTPVTNGMAQYIALAAKYVKLIKDYWDDIQCILQLIAAVLSIFNAIIELAKEVIEHVKRIVEMLSNLNISEILKQFINSEAIKALLMKELEKAKLNIISAAKNSILQANLEKSKQVTSELQKQVDSADSVKAEIKNYAQENAATVAEAGGLNNLTVNNLSSEVKTSVLANAEKLGLSKYGNLETMSLQQISDLADSKKALAMPSLSANLQNMARITTEIANLKAFEDKLIESHNADMSKYLAVVGMAAFSATLRAASKDAKINRLKSIVKKPKTMVDSSGKFTIAGLVYYLSNNKNLINSVITADICLCYAEGTATTYQKNYLDSLRNAPAFRDIAPALASGSGEMYSDVEQMEKTVNEEFLRIAQKEASGKPLTQEEKNFKDAAAKDQVKDPNEQTNPDTQSSKPAPTMPTKEDEQNQRVETPSQPSNELKGMPQEDLKNFIFNDTGWTPDLTTDYFTGERNKRTYLPGILIQEEDITKFDKYVIFTSKLHPYQRMKRPCDLDILEDLIPIMKQELKEESDYLQKIIERLLSDNG